MFSGGSVRHYVKVTSNSNVGVALKSTGPPLSEIQPMTNDHCDFYL